MPNFNTTYSAEEITKKGIWLYLLLLIFEGALRKWVLPELSAPLIVVRDPIALGLLCFAIYHRLLSWNTYLLIILFVGLIAIPTTLIVGHGNLYVTLFGARYYLIHFPFLFLIATLFNKSDVEQFGRFLLWITPLMTLLIAIQFYSPQSAWVNRGLGGSELGSGFSGALGYFRPAAIFSFTSGTSTFFSLATAYVVYFWLSKAHIRRFLLLLATISVLIAIPFSISRTYLFQFIIIVGFGLFVSLRNPQTLFRIGLATMITLVTYAGLRQMEFFQTSTMVFEARFTGANETEGGLEGVLGNRFLGEHYRAFLDAGEKPFWGYGLGIGTNTGRHLLANESYLPFVSTEGEWQRIISESGPFLGIIVILIRFALGISLFIGSWRAIQSGNILPWMLVSIGFLQIISANWAQPMSLGFSVVIAGFVLASIDKGEY